MPDKKEKKNTWDKIRDWWNKPTPAEKEAIDINKRKAARGPISIDDNKPVVYGRKRVVMGNLTEDEKSRFEDFNGPLLDPDKGPMPQRYHRNKHDDAVGAQRYGSQSESSVFRNATEAVAKEKADEDMKEWIKKLAAENKKKKN